MAQQDTFKWHDTATLRAGPLRIVRPVAGVPYGLQNITKRDLNRVLTSLGQAVITGDPFCITEQPLPKGITVETGDFLTLTGGSSGTPKVVCRSQASWIASFDVNQRIFGFRAGQSVATLGQPSHSLALYAVLEALHLGMQAHVLAGQPPTEQRAAIKTNKIETLYATPTQLRLLASGHSDTLLPDLQHILCGGGVLDGKTTSAVQSLCPNAAIHQFYGAAETSFVTLSDADTPKGSVGRAYPDVELHIEEGEVWVRSPYLFKGYVAGKLNDVHKPNGFVSVGETGTLDTDGNLWLKGRSSRMFNVADQCMYPEQIEQHILDCVEATGCAVLPEPDPLRGNRVVVIVEAPESIALTAKIKDACSAKFGPIATPRKILFCTALPQLASGKTDIHALTNWLGTQL